ncbi:MAG: MarC family protein, partial [Methanomassiliicoccales archaeon]|nr:MarC family protein [Methanomassiliicoccales archaeon]
YEATSRSDGFLDIISVFIGIVLTVLISYFLLHYSEGIIKRMGRSGAMAFSRVMGLLLAAVAVSFMLSGVFQAIRDAGFL